MILMPGWSFVTLSKSMRGVRCNTSGLLIFLSNRFSLNHKKKTVPRVLSPPGPSVSFRFCLVRTKGSDSSNDEFAVLVAAFDTFDLLALKGA